MNGDFDRRLVLNRLLMLSLMDAMVSLVVKVL